MPLKGGFFHFLGTPADRIDDCALVHGGALADAPPYTRLGVGSRGWVAAWARPTGQGWDVPGLGAAGVSAYLAILQRPQSSQWREIVTNQQEVGPLAGSAQAAGRRKSWLTHAAATALAIGVGLGIGTAAAQSGNLPTIVDVQPGDTFSAIAARYTGDPRIWRKLYNAEQSGLANPNVITPGMRLELVTEASGSKFLRLVGGKAAVVAKAAAPAPAAAPAVKPPAPAAAAVAAAPAPAPASMAAAAPAAPAADGALVIGVLPNVAASLLLPQYEYMRRYLERVGGQKVRIVVPANFKVFFDATMAGEYDLAVAAPHFARVAQQERGMVPLVTYEPRINALMVVPADSTVAGPKDMRERAVAFANPQSLVAMYGVQWLRGHGLEAGKDFEVKGARTDLGVGRMLLSGDAVAAIMSNGEFRALPADESSRLKIGEVFARIPNFITMAHPRLERDKINHLRTQLKAFLADADDGAAFARATGFSGITDVDDAQMRELDPYSAQTRRVMGFVK